MGAKDRKEARPANFVYLSGKNASLKNLCARNSNSSDAIIEQLFLSLPKRRQATPQERW